MIPEGNSKESILDEIRKFLEENPHEIRGVKSSKKTTISSLIERIEAFGDFNEYLSLKRETWSLRRKWRQLALNAVIEFIRQYPMLDHTPNSLRSCFGMPTRTDRKKGRYSSIELRNKAIFKGLNPQNSDLALIKRKISIFGRSNPNYRQNVQQIISYINKVMERDFISQIQVPPLSNHTEEDIESIANYLKGHKFDILDIDEDEELSPDLVASYNSKIMWVEYKDYHTAQHSLKIIYQIFKYLKKNPRVLLISTEKMEIFDDLLRMNQSPVMEVKNWTNRQLKTQRRQLGYWKNQYKKSFKEILPSVSQGNQKIEILICSIITEIIMKEIGSIGAEILSLKNLLNLLKDLEENFTILPFQTFLESHNFPKGPVIYLKWGFGKKFENVKENENDESPLRYSFG